MTWSNRTSRAFTLIELTAAILIGSLVVSGSLAVFGGLSRADDRFALRYDHTTEMERTYLAVQRSLRTLVVSDRLTGQELEPPMPRLMLSAQPGSTKMRPPGWESSRVLVVGDDRDRPQRLEVVVSKAPIVSPLQGDLSRIGVEALGMDPGEFSFADPVAVRGAFVLRESGRTRRGAQLWQLVWEPMIAIRPAEGPPFFAPGPPEMDIVLAEDVLWCRWQVFLDNERLLTHAATTVLDLPAYVELELQLSSGMMSNWMFEIAWTEGPELPEILPIVEDPGNAPAEAGETRTTPSGGGTNTFTPSGGGTNSFTPAGGGTDR